MFRKQITKVLPLLLFEDQKCIKSRYSYSILLILDMVDYAREKNRPRALIGIHQEYAFSPVN